jgi:hypothetical protein
MKRTLWLIGLLLAAIAAAQAQTATPGVGSDQLQQQRRIRQGVRSGELTAGETLQLQAQQGRIHRAKKRAKADGVVTPGERVKLNARQNRASRNIRRQKNDRQDRY